MPLSALIVWTRKERLTIQRRRTGCWPTAACKGKDGGSQKMNGTFFSLGSSINEDCWCTGRARYLRPGAADTFLSLLNWFFSPAHSTLCLLTHDPANSD